MSIFGDRVKARRIQLELTQQQLADRTGYRYRSSINRIEQGQVEATLDKIEIFAKALHTSRSYLVGWVDDPDEEVTEIRTADGFVRAKSRENGQLQSGHSSDHVYTEPEYYLDPETTALAQRIYEDKELRALFDTAADATPADLQAAHLFLKALKEREQQG